MRGQRKALPPVDGSQRITGQSRTVEARTLAFSDLGSDVLLQVDGLTLTGSLVYVSHSLRYDSSSTWLEVEFAGRCWRTSVSTDHLVVFLGRAAS